MFSGKQFAECALNSKWDKYKYEQLDCQGFVEAVLADIGVRKPNGQVYNWRGSNSMYRTYEQWIGTKDECIKKFGFVPVGALVFVWEETGEEERGYTDKKGNAKHVGVYCGGDIVRDSTKTNKRDGVGNSVLSHYNKVGLLDMLDYTIKTPYNENEQIITELQSIRNSLDIIERLLKK